MNLLKALNWRYAVRQFSDEKLSHEKIKTLLNLTCLSASSYGLQPYKMLLIESSELRKALLPYSCGQEKVLYCSHLLLFTVYREIDDRTVDCHIEKYVAISGQSHESLSDYAAQRKQALAAMSDTQKQAWAHQQVSIALGNLLTCAALMQIDSCPIGGFERAGYDQVLGLKEKGLTASVVCPLGIRHPQDIQAARPKVRFDYDELVEEL